MRFGRGIPLAWFPSVAARSQKAWLIDPTIHIASYFTADARVARGESEQRCSRSVVLTNRMTHHPVDPAMVDYSPFRKTDLRRPGQVRSRAMGRLGHLSGMINHRGQSDGQAPRWPISRRTRPDVPDHLVACRVSMPRIRQAYAWD